MPTYDYKCKKCSKVKDVFHGINSTPLIKCDKCGGTCNKEFSTNTQFILKGSGWNDKERRMKTQMTARNSKMNEKMKDKERNGEAVRNMGELKKRKS